eukprot:5658037-Pyramimonas_sp.AAC.1
MFRRGQPVGTWAGEIALWATPVKRKAACKQIVDQCLTGLRHSYGALIKKSTDMMANHPAILKALDNKIRSGYRETRPSAQPRSGAGGPEYCKDAFDH